MTLGNDLEYRNEFHHRSILARLAGGRSRGAKNGSGWLGLQADLPPEMAEAIDSFERTSFRLTYAIVGFAGVALALTFVIAYCMILVGGR